MKFYIKFFFQLVISNLSQISTIISRDIIKLKFNIFLDFGIH